MIILINLLFCVADLGFYFQSHWQPKNWGFSDLVGSDWGLGNCSTVVSSQ